MAFRTGTRVDPRLMEIDYSPSIRAGELMGATIGDVGSTIGKVITTKAEKKKDKASALAFIRTMKGLDDEPSSVGYPKPRTRGDVITSAYPGADSPTPPDPRLLNGLGAKPSQKPSKATFDFYSNLEKEIKADNINFPQTLSMVNNWITREEGQLNRELDIQLAEIRRDTSLDVAKIAAAGRNQTTKVLSVADHNVKMLSQVKAAQAEGMPAKAFPDVEGRLQIYYNLGPPTDEFPKGEVITSPEGQRITMVSDRDKSVRELGNTTNQLTYFQEIMSSKMGDEDRDTDLTSFLTDSGKKEYRSFNPKQAEYSKPEKEFFKSLGVTPPSDYDEYSKIYDSFMDDLGTTSKHLDEFDISLLTPPDKFATAAIFGSVLITSTINPTNPQQTRITLYPHKHNFGLPNNVDSQHFVRTNMGGGYGKRYYYTKFNRQNFGE